MSKMIQCKTCGSPIAKSAATCPNCGAKNKKKHPILGIILVLLGVTLIFAALGSSSEEPQNTGGTSGNESSPSAVSTTIPYETELTSGFYTAGIDFPAGKYDIEVVSGGGNVSSSNMFSGGLNLVMGVEEKDAALGTDLYEQSYKNAKLDKGVVLSVSGGVTIKISSEAASADPLTPREQDITDPVQLSSGNYVAGEDFPAGIYNITAISGNGNVSSSNMYNGGLNAIMGTDTSMGLYEKSYKNVEFTSGVELTISGVDIELTPSK